MKLVIVVASILSSPVLLHAEERATDRNEGANSNGTLSEHHADDAIRSEISELRKISEELVQRLENLEKRLGTRKYAVHDIITVIDTRKVATGKTPFDSAPPQIQSARIAAEIVEIEPNGLLRIESRREVINNLKLITWKLSGIVRPTVIEPATKSVNSDEIAELRIDTSTFPTPR